MDVSGWVCCRLSLWALEGAGGTQRTVVLPRALGTTWQEPAVLSFGAAPGPPHELTSDLLQEHVLSPPCMPSWSQAFVTHR